jgi:sigma-E factor negative regulatory protein RseA
MKTQQSELSALLDGELEDHEARHLLKQVIADGELRQTWQDYALIGDHLRQECPSAPDLTASIMARVRDEAVVLAPRNLNLRSVKRHHPLLAMAASLAGVAVVGWLAVMDSQQSSGPGAQLAAVPPAPTFAQPVARQAGVHEPQLAVLPPTMNAGDLSEYLLAHHAQASTFRLGDNTEHVRTVSMNRPSQP